MKNHIKLTTTLSLLTCACALFNASSAQAALTGYHVEVVTSPLVGNPNAPFYLDFQMNYGSGPFGNNSTIKNFNFVGGSPVGSPTLSGTAEGGLSKTLTLLDSSGTTLRE